MDKIDFLMKAKNNTYADGGGQPVTLADGCKELVYHQQEWDYCDRYYGFNPFIGEELLIKSGKVIWVMNYRGGVTADDVDEGAVYAFLQRAMSRLERARPYRGPELYKEGDYEYRDLSSGSFELFQGEERILFQGREVYHLVYHGGQVVKE